MTDAPDREGEKRKAGRTSGWRISERGEQAAYWAAAAGVFAVICAVLVLETVLPFAADQPAQPAAAVVEAEQLMQQRELRQARIKLDDHIGDNPDDARAHALRGLLRSATGLYAAALDDYDRAVRLDPENVGYRQSRADINANVGWLEKASADYNAILIRDPGNQRALISRARVSMQQGDVTHALADVDIALEVEPENPEAHLLRAQLMQNIGNAEEALASYRRVEGVQGEIGQMVQRNIELLEDYLQQIQGSGQ